MDWMHFGLVYLEIQSECDSPMSCWLSLPALGADPPGAAVSYSSGTNELT